MLDHNAWKLVTDRYLVSYMSAEEKLHNFSNKDKVAESFEKSDAVMGLVAAKGLEKCEGKCNSDKGGTICDAVVSKVDEEKKSKSNQYNCCTYLKQTAVLLWTERIILVLVCIAIAAGFTVPIIVYEIDTDREDISTLLMGIDLDSCQALNSTSSQVCLCIYMQLIA